MSSGMMSPVVSERRPGPTARTSPCWGFSLAVSGMTRPEAVVSSASLGRTTIRSSSGSRLMVLRLRWHYVGNRNAGGISTLTGRVLTIPAHGPYFNRSPELPQRGLGGSGHEGQLEVGLGPGVERRGPVDAVAVPGG